MQKNILDVKTLRDVFFGLIIGTRKHFPLSHYMYYGIRFRQSESKSENSL